MTKKPSEGMKAALASIHKDYGKAAIINMGGQVFDPCEKISTGALTLDVILNGGIPRGMITEIIGPEGVGKSTLCMHIMANAQKLGHVVLIDTEHVFDPPYAQAIGMDMDELYLTQPDNAEMGLEIADRMIKTGEVALIVVDSVAGLVPRAELEGLMGDAHVGVSARLMNQAIRKLVPPLKKTDTAAIFTNQIRMKIGGYGNPETTPGGQGLKYAANVRMDMRRGELIKEGTDVNGQRAKVKTLKSKVSKPMQVCEFDIIFGEGISTEGCILDAALAHKLVALKGSFYMDVATGENLGQGREKSKIYLRENPGLVDEYTKKMLAT